MGDSDRPTYTETMVSVEKKLSQLDERTKNTNERLAAMDEKLDEIVKLKERVVKVETKQGILATFNMIFSTLAAGIATWLGTRS